MPTAPGRRSSTGTEQLFSDLSLHTARTGATVLLVALAMVAFTQRFGRLPPFALVAYGLVFALSSCVAGLGWALAVVRPCSGIGLSPEECRLRKAVHLLWCLTICLVTPLTSYVAVVVS